MKNIIELNKEEEQRALDLHKKAILIDAHNASGMDSKCLQNMKLGGLTAFKKCAVRNWLNFRQSIEYLYHWYRRIDENSDKVFLATTVEDIKRAKKQEKHAFLFGFENVKPIEDDIRLLKIFYKLGVSSISLTYNQRNFVGDGCTERTNAGLSDFGLNMVEEMNRIGILIDVSHCGEATTKDAIEFSKDPIVFSHTCARELNENARNKSDDMFMALTEKGGIIGIAIVPYFLTSKLKPTWEDWLDHVDHVANLVGVNHVGIGTDLNESGSTSWDFQPWIPPKGPIVAHNQKEYSEIYLHSKPKAYPRRPVAPIMQNNTEFPNMTKGLVSRGYSDEEIEKILGGNFLRLFERVWK